MKLSDFPAGTRVRIRERISHRERPVESEVVGTIESWEDLPTGSWYAHGKNDKLWLKRLKLRKDDGELSLLVVDDATEITRVDAAAG